MKTPTKIVQDFLCENETHGYLDENSGKRIVHCYMDGLIELIEGIRKEHIAYCDEIVKQNNSVSDREKEELGHNIGMLRQYLNERTSKDLITNEELEIFLLK